jgi:hypothetical protein
MHSHRSHPSGSAPVLYWYMIYCVVCWKRIKLHNILVIYCVSVENEATTYYIDILVAWFVKNEATTYYIIDITISPFPCYIRGLLRTKQQHITIFIDIRNVYWLGYYFSIGSNWQVIFQWTGYFVHWIQWTDKIPLDNNWIHWIHWNISLVS